MSNIYAEIAGRIGEQIEESKEGCLWLVGCWAMIMLFTAGFALYGIYRFIAG